MKREEVKDLLIRSLDPDCEPDELSRIAAITGISYEFREGFAERVMNRVYSMGSVVAGGAELIKGMNKAFYRIAFTGAAAIILLLLSFLAGQGTVSIDSLLGLGTGYDESIICLLTGK